MPWVPNRPPALTHLSDEAASIVLARHFGDFVAAARELGVDRKDLGQLTRHNPRILKAAHARIELFRIGVRSKIMEAMYSPSAKRRRWGIDAMSDSYEFRDYPFANARWSEPAQRERVAKAGRARLILEQEAVAEQERERILEREREREREAAVERDREAAVVLVDRRAAAGRVRAPEFRLENARYAGVRRPTRGRS